MQIPASVELAYWPEHANANELKELCGGRLWNNVCKPNQWLFADRVKGLESATAKLQLSGVRQLSEMHDLYAATVVVPTPTELKDAVDAIKDAFDRDLVTRTTSDPETFAYDNIHLHVTLGNKAPGLPPLLRDRVFEVQVRTGLQYAWWRATHDTVYKGGDQTWRLARVASQARASLELTDALLADLRKAAKMLADTKTEEDRAFRATLKWLNATWPEARRPNDVLRFFRAVRELAKATDRSDRQLRALMQKPEGKRLVGESM